MSNAPTIPARLRISDMGHAYGKANRTTQADPVFGDTIQMGEAIRKCTVTLRDGTTRTGYVANRTIGLFSFCDDHSPAYFGNPADIVDQLPEGTTLWTLEQGQKEWTRQGKLEATRRYNGKDFVDGGVKWVKGYSSTRSSKKLASDLRRNKRILGFVLDSGERVHRNIRTALPEGVKAPAPVTARAAADAALEAPKQGELVCVMTELREAVGFLRSDRDRDFAGSLLGYYQRAGKLTPKQWPHAKRLADKAMRAAPRGFGQHIVGILS